MNNLPSTTLSSDRVEVKEFFDKYFQQEVSFPASQVDATVGFFLKNGFGEESAKSTAIVLLNQAKLDNVNVMTLIDSLKTLTSIQLNQVVAQVLNSYRENTSILGYRVQPNVDTFESRNILI